LTSNPSETLSLGGKSVLVTGGAGFIGSHLVDRIITERPSNLVVADNMFLGKRANLEEAAAAYPALRIHEQDVSDYEAMADLLATENVEVVFDLAVIPLPTSLERPRWTVDTNVAMATTMCELLRQGRYRTLVHFSSSEVYGTAQYVPMDELHPLVPLTPYAASKAAADHIVLSYQRSFDVDVAVVRPFNTYGPRQNERAYAGVIPRVVERALQGLPVMVDGDGHQTRDFGYVTDVADAAIRVYEHPATRGRTVNVASGREVSINDLIGRLLEVLGTDLPVLRQDARPGDVRRHLGSSDLLAELTGPRPLRDLSTGLEATVAWYRTAMAESGRP